MWFSTEIVFESLCGLFICAYSVSTYFEGVTTYLFLTPSLRLSCEHVSAPRFAPYAVHIIVERVYGMNTLKAKPYKLDLKLSWTSLKLKLLVTVLYTVEIMAYTINLEC